MVHRGAWLPFGDDDSSIGVVRVRRMGRNDFATPGKGILVDGDASLQDAVPGNRFCIELRHDMLGIQWDSLENGMRGIFGLQVYGAGRVDHGGALREAESIAAREITTQDHYGSLEAVPSHPLGI